MVYFDIHQYLLNMYHQSNQENTYIDRFDMSHKHILMDWLSTMYVHTIDLSGNNIDIHREDFHT